MPWNSLVKNPCAYTFWTHTSALRIWAHRVDRGTASCQSHCRFRKPHLPYQTRSISSLFLKIGAARRPSLERERVVVEMGHVHREIVNVLDDREILIDFSIGRH